MTLLMVKRKDDTDYSASGDVTVPLYNEGDEFTAGMPGTLLRLRVRRLEVAAEGSSTTDRLYVDEV